jgi:predicted phage terminase large subunit-like protein
MAPSYSSLPNPTIRAPHPEDWRPNPGPQTRFLSLTCHEALYGGAAGGGKSDALLVDAIRYVGRGYGRNYKALLLRREFPDLEKSLIERSHALYPRIGGKWNGSAKTWRFPLGEVVYFGHAQHERDVHQYQGAEFQFVGFDEVTSFTKYQYTYLISRLRSSAGVPCRLRGATNPGGEGHDWVFDRFGAWLDPKSPVRAEPGRVVYFVRDEEGNERAAAKGDDGARGRTFVPALLSDNPFIGDAYARGLDELDPVTREQLKRGNWLIRPAAGLYFKRDWFEFVDSAPAVGKRIRYWDRAATAASGSNDPDWTAGVKLCLAPDGLIYVEDVVRFRGNPGEVEKVVKTTAELDGKGVPVGIEQDPGQAGKFEAAYYIKALAGWRVTAYPVTAKKVVRAGPISSQALAKNVRIVRGKWNEAFVTELEQFPEGSHDDQVDGLSGAYSAVGTAITIDLSKWVV